MPKREKTIRRDKHGKWVVRWDNEPKADGTRKQRSKSFNTQVEAKVFLEKLEATTQHQSTDVSLMWMLQAHKDDPLAAMRFLMHELRSAKRTIEHERQRRIDAEDGTLFRYLVQQYGNAVSVEKTRDPIAGKKANVDRVSVVLTLLEQQAPKGIRKKDICEALQLKGGSSYQKIANALRDNPNVHYNKDFGEYSWRAA